MSKLMNNFPKVHYRVMDDRMIPKRSFDNALIALDFMKTHGLDENKVHPYQCNVCGKWHIGTNKKH